VEGVGKHTPYCMGSTTHSEKASELGKKTERDDSANLQQNSETGPSRVLFLKTRVSQ
jgi:hypothetical protein